MKRIDAHQHFWKFNPSTARAHRVYEDAHCADWDFFPNDLWPLLNENGFEGCVAVQSNQSEKETDFLIALAKRHKFIKGVVGWVDLQAGDIMERLEWYRFFPILKGFRHLLQNEHKRDLMLRPFFKRGIAALQHHGYTYDILIFPDQLKYASRLAAFFPDQPFVIDLLALPDLGHSEIAGWRADIRRLALRQNVYCKISGMITGMSGIGPIRRDFRYYIDVIVDAFGMDRIMYGSDWPLCQGSASYQEVTRLVQAYFSTFSKEEQELLFVWNAVNFYNL